MHSLACLLMFLAHIAAGWQSGQYLIFTRPINSLLQSLFWQIFLTSLMTRDSFAHFLHWEFRPSLLALSMVKSDIYNSAAHLLHLLCPSATPSWETFWTRQSEQNLTLLWCVKSSPHLGFWHFSSYFLFFWFVWRHFLHLLSRPYFWLLSLWKSSRDLTSLHILHFLFPLAISSSVILLDPQSLQYLTKWLCVKSIPQSGFWHVKMYFASLHCLLAHCLQ